MLEEAAQDVKLQEGAEVANMAVVVDRGSAHVHAQRLAIDWLKFFDSMGESVEKSDDHPGGIFTNNDPTVWRN